MHTETSILKFLQHKYTSEQQPPAESSEGKHKFGAPVFLYFFVPFGIDQLIFFNFYLKNSFRELFLSNLRGNSGI